MKDGEMVLIAPPLLESRIGAYVEWLPNEVLVMLFANKIIQQTYIAYHTPWSRKAIPTSRVSLASTLCTQDLFYPYCRYSLRSSSYVKDSSGGYRRILVSISLDVYFYSAI